jgi:hypothetical protein
MSVKFCRHSGQTRHAWHFFFGELHALDFSQSLNWRLTPISHVSCRRRSTAFGSGSSLWHRASGVLNADPWAEAHRPPPPGRRLRWLSQLEEHPGAELNAPIR